MTIEQIFTPFTKSEKQADGSLMVFGKVTGPDLDLDKQIMDAGWLAKAMPEWMKWGNVREQHSTIAAGVGKVLEQQGDDWFLKSHIVDPGSVAKVEAGVLTGYSIGVAGGYKLVKDATAPGGRVVDGMVAEVSIVDRPCNPTCSIAIAKSVDGTLVKSDTDEVLELDAEVEEPAEVDPEPEVEGDEPVADPDPAPEVEGDEPVAELELDGPDDDATKAVTADLTKDDETAEVSIIASARALLTSWLASEAAEVDESGGSTLVVQGITWLLNDLDWLAELDAQDDADQALAALNERIAPQEDEPMNLSTVAELVKAASSEDATDEDRAPLAELTKALGLDAIIAKLTEADSLKDTLAGVEANLAKVMEMAAPGGPTRIAPEADAAKAAARDAHLTKAAHFEQLSAQAEPRSALASDYAAAAAVERAAATNI